MQNISQRTRAVRTVLGLSQGELAKRMLYSRNYISLIERGEQDNPSQRFLAELAQMEAEAKAVQARTIVGNSPRERLRNAMQKAGLDARDLAKRIGAPIAEIQGVVDGASYTITESMAERICGALPDLTVEDLLSGSDSPRMYEESGITGTLGARPNLATPHGMRVRYVPLLSWAQAGAMNEFTDEAYSDEAVVTIDLPCEKAFALRIRGDSMYPRLREGDVVVLCAEWTPRMHDIVVAKTSDGDVMCKIYQPKNGGDKVVFASINSTEHPPIERSKEEIVWIYPVQSIIQTIRHRD